MAHQCPECLAICHCLSGDIVERNCDHCDDVLGDVLEDDDEVEDDEDED